MVEELLEFDLMKGVPRQEVEWVAEHGNLEEFEQGEFFIREGQDSDRLFIVLAGEMQLSRTIDKHVIVLGTAPRGTLGNELTLLHNTAAYMSVLAIVPSRLCVLNLRAFRELFTACPTLGMRILKTASERMQTFSKLIKQQEKMAALGKLSAGLAHELNNPAAAARRAAHSLRGVLPELQRHTIRLCGLGLEAEHFAILLDFQDTFAQKSPPTLTPLERSDFEDDVAAYLEQLGIEDGWELAPSFVNSGVEYDEIETIIECMPQAARLDIVQWLHSSLSVLGLFDEVEQSSARISDLVNAVKSYTFMDQGAVQEINIHTGLDATLTMLNHKLKQVIVRRNYDHNLPHIMAKGGELNQVWTNIIDNAVDAMQGRGELEITTRCEDDAIVVELSDNGPGIPEQVLPHIFEAFYTTKAAGQGTGLGMDISYRIVKQHNGSIEVQSQPGLTRFSVRLPTSNMIKRC